MEKKKGFTLIELLVVIAIIGILGAIAAVTYSKLQKDSRDTKRKSDLAVIQSALEQYHADQGFYPAWISGDTSTLDCFNALKPLVITKTNLVLSNQTGQPPSLPLPPLTKTYLSKIPTDPKNLCSSDLVNSIYFYVPKTDCNNQTDYCTSYCLYAKMENASNNSIDSSCADTNLTGDYLNYKYSVHSP